MGALKPNNDKYRKLWKIWGRNMNPSEEYVTNYDQVRWGEGTKKVVVENQKLAGHYIIHFEK